MDLRINVLKCDAGLGAKLLLFGLFLTCLSNVTGFPFIFGIEVHSGQRGKGYGRAIMLAGEDECRRRGYAQLDLNVFGNNRTAISLYESLGYTVTSQQMRKRL